jgi:nucleoside-diphosphate-sugar epimerase
VAAVRPAYVLHLAAYTHVAKSWHRVDECVQTNIQGTINLLQALARVDYARFVYTGTSEIYGDVTVPFQEHGPVNPVSPYAVSKYAGERYCRMFHQGRGWPVVMLRPFNAFGPAQSPDRVIPEIITKALRGQELHMTGGRQTREFNYVDDLADGFVRAVTAAGIDGEIINLGCGVEISMRELAGKVLSLLGDPIQPRFGALPDRPNEIWRMYADASKARDRLGWQPTTSLDEGLRRTVEWYRAELERAGSPFAP